MPQAHRSTGKYCDPLVSICPYNFNYDIRYRGKPVSVHEKQFKLQPGAAHYRADLPDNQQQHHNLYDDFVSLWLDSSCSANSNKFMDVPKLHALHSIVASNIVYTEDVFLDDGVLHRRG